MDVAYLSARMITSLSEINGHLTVSEAVTYLRDTATTAQLVQRDDVDAIEIHTSGRQTAAFEKVWDGMKDSISYLKLVAISLPDVGESTISVINTMFSIMRPNLGCYNLWQVRFFIKS